jgi:membrane fusion protein, multidrug efflux system
VNKVRLLVDKNVISKTELDVAEAKWIAALSKVDEAKSAVSTASIRLSYAHIRAPFDGIIDRIPLKNGSLINEGSLLTTLSDNKEVYTYFNVSENEYLNYVKANLKTSASKNTKVKLILSDGSKYSHPGTIETVEGEIEPTTGSIAFRARFPNPDKILKHGASGKVIISTVVRDALFLPQKCVFEIQDKNYVFLVDSMNKVVMKSFIPKTRLENYYLIQSGLECGNNILYEGLQNIQDGNSIVPRPISLDSMIRSSL